MNKKLKICFFCGNIEGRGGTERVTTLIANELKSRGYDISILSYLGGRKSGFKLNKEIQVFTLVKDESIDNSKMKRNLFPIYFLYKFIKKEKIDIIIDVDILLSLYTIKLKCITNIKVVSWEHFNLSNNNGVKKRDIARLLASKYSNKVVVLTEEDKGAYEEKFKNVKNIECIYNPTSFKVLNDNVEREKKIISVGRLTKVKGFDLLLDAWAKIEKLHVDWKLQVIGSGECYKELSYQISTLGLDNVELLPFKENIEEYYKSASIYVMASRNEGFPMVLLEAQSFGLPIISFDCKTGPREIITNGKDGILVKDGDVNKLACSISELIRNEKLLKMYSENSKANVERFSVEVIVDKWEKILNSI